MRRAIRWGQAVPFISAVTMAAALSGCAPEPDPVDLALPSAYEDPGWPAGHGPTLRWAADRTKVVVQFPDALLTSCSQDHSADLEQADDYNFTIQIASTRGSGSCLSDGHVFSETLNLPSGRIPDAPVFVDVVFPDSGKGFELTMN